MERVAKDQFPIWQETPEFNGLVGRQSPNDIFCWRERDLQNWAAVWPFFGHWLKWFFVREFNWVHYRTVENLNVYKVVFPEIHNVHFFCYTLPTGFADFPVFAPGGLFLGHKIDRGLRPWAKICRVDSVHRDVGIVSARSQTGYVDTFLVVDIRIWV